MAKKIKTQWDLKLLYKNDKDPQIQKDIENFSRKIKNFSRKYKNNDNYLKNSDSLLKALTQREKIFSSNESIRPLLFLYLKIDKNSNDKKTRSELNRIGDIYNNLINEIIFFNLKIGQLSKVRQQKFLKDQKLEKYHFALRIIFERAEHHLSESEERIMNLVSRPAKTMWTQGFEKVLNNQSVKFKGKEIGLSEATSIISELNKKDREILNKKIMQKLIEVSDFCEAEMNSLIAFKKISDDLRGFEKPYSSTIKNYSNEVKTVENLVDTVTKNMKISHRFYKLKAQLLKQDKLGYQDRGAKIGELNKKFTFPETVDFLRKSFEKIDSKYKDIFDSYLYNGQVDVYPQKGKTSGAYCSGNYGMPTFILLNHTNDFRSLVTFAHEMGHGFHTEFSNTQPAIYADYSMSTAEVASTFFENFVFEEILEGLTDNQKIIALHDKINSQISTVFRQIACFNFENEIHLKGRESGYLPREEMAKIMNKHMKSYLGPKFKLQDEDGYYFVAWPHIRRSFYVYSYAFGSIISDALYYNYKKDKKYLKKVEKFLKAGGSKKPEDIFKDAGIDIRDPKFFEEGLKVIESNIDRLEKLVKAKK